MSSSQLEKSCWLQARQRHWHLHAACTSSRIRALYIYSLRDSLLGTSQTFWAESNVSPSLNPDFPKTLALSCLKASKGPEKSHARARALKNKTKNAKSRTGATKQPRKALCSPLIPKSGHHVGQLVSKHGLLLQQGLDLHKEKRV